MDKNVMKETIRAFSITNEELASQGHTKKEGYSKCVTSCKVKYKVYFYRSQTKLRKGNVFRSVCQEFCPQGGGACVAGVCMAGDTATAADGTHPTGMHSCW